MQAKLDPELSEEEAKKLSDELGCVDAKVPYNQETFNRLLATPGVEKVVVSRLKKGMIIAIGEDHYKIQNVRADGKVNMRRVIMRRK